MDYDEEQMEEKSFKVSSGDEDDLYDDLDDGLEPETEGGVSFEKEEEEEEKDAY